MASKPTGSPRILTILCLLSISVSSSVAQVERDRSGVGQKEFRRAELNIVDSYQSPRELPEQAAAQASADLAELGLDTDSGRLDVRGGRWGTLVLRRPLIPGRGVGNNSVWPDGPPRNDAALKQASWAAFANFLESRNTQLRINVSELPAPGKVTVREKGKLIQLHGPRVIDGVPVRDSYVTAVISRGNLVLFGAKRWGNINISRHPQLSEDESIAEVELYLDPYRVAAFWGENHLAIVPMARGHNPHQVSVGQGYDYRLVWVIRPSFDGDLGNYEALVDAHTGELLSFVDTNQYESDREVKGGVYPVTNDGSLPGGIERAGWPMPFDNITTEIGIQTTDGGGNLPTPVSGTISSTLSGQYIRINDNCGPIDLSTSLDVLDFGTSDGTDCITPGFGGLGNTHSSRTGFFELNRISEMARSRLPNNSWLKKRLTANMNIVDTCNAFWNGSTVNFFRSGDGCGNTGEIPAVFDHEWGHGLDSNDANPGGSSPGEGIADLYAYLRLGTSCIGQGFYLEGTCGGFGDPCIDCTGIRDINYEKRASGLPHDVAWSDANCPDDILRAGPCGGSVHCEGAVYAEAVYELVNRDLPGHYGMDHNTALEVATRLTFAGATNVGTWFQCITPYAGCGADSGYLNYLAADDDNGDLSDGTPHMQAIFDAFDRHGIACNNLTVQDSGCSNTPTTAPTLISIPADKSASLSWSSVPDATSYQVLRTDTDGLYGCDFGKIKVGETVGTSFSDSGLQNGRSYSYIVVPIGESDTCIGPASNCTTIKPVLGPNLSVNTDSANLVALTGDGDDFLDNCEQGSMYFDVTNTGLGALTNLRIVDVNPISHPETAIITTFPQTFAATLAEDAVAVGSFDFVAGGLSYNETLILQVEVTADELLVSKSYDVTVELVESDFAFRPSFTWDFETGLDGWTTLEGTFNQSTPGGADGSSGYVASSANLADQCDHIRSPMMILSPTSTLSMWTNFDIEGIIWPHPGYRDRANVGVYEVVSDSRTLINPDGGRGYVIGPVPGGTCGTEGQAGWVDSMPTWDSSIWSPAALESGFFTGAPIQLDIRYGTNTYFHFGGFWFDKVTVTDVETKGPDLHSDFCNLSCASDSECDDGLFCNGIETCGGSGSCEAGTPVSCHDAIACTFDSCNEATDSCAHATSDALCDNGLYCDGAETCDAVNDCQPGTAPACDDSVACTIDSCNEGTGSCDNLADDASCDNGLFCDGAETCDVVQDCLTGVSPCSGQLCDEPNDTCTECLDNIDCDDSLFCNGIEICDGSGSCQAGTAPVCDDSVACTVDSCNEATASCAFAASDAFCDNGLYCDGAETCNAVTDCQPGTAPVVDDGVTCTNDSCDEASDTIFNTPDDALCDNGLFCDGAEICDAVTDCQAGTAPVVDDGVTCTNDGCDETSDTIFNTPDDALCDNGLFCDGAEICDAVLNCLTGIDPCPDEFCDESIDGCGDGPDLAVDTSSAALTILGGDGDDTLDNCEQGSMDFDVANIGLGELTNLRIVDVIPISHPETTVTTSFPYTVAATLAEDAVGVGTFDFVAGGMSYNETLVFQIQLTADELAVNKSYDLTVEFVEKDFAFYPSVTWNFGPGLEDWTVIEGTFNQSSPGGVDDDGYVASSGNLAHQCDHVRSPVMALSSTSTLSMWTNFDIEAIVWPHPGYHDRANVGVYEVSNDSRTVIAPDSGRGYVIGPVPGGTCGTEGQAGWVDEMPTWDSSIWSPDALESTSYAGQPIQLDIRYGTNTYYNFGGFWFDKVTVTDVELEGPDLHSDYCNLSCASDAECDDGLFCNGAETCGESGSCQPGTPVSCQDAVTCTIDLCNEGTDSCDNLANNAFCDNGLFCDGAETCDAIQGCLAGIDPCSGQFCDESNDICAECLDDTNCDDGLFCNGIETCGGSRSCQAGTAPVVDDGVACTNDSCDEASDTIFNTPDNALCDNGLFCDGAETCDGAQDCLPGIEPCPGQLCNEASDGCEESPDFAVDTSSAELTISGGDGDNTLDNCEQGAMDFDVANTGLGELTNLRIVDVTPISHPETTITTSFPQTVAAALAEDAVGVGSFDFVAGGMSYNETLVFQVELTADELAVDKSYDMVVKLVETDLSFHPSFTWDFETGLNDWTTIEGTFSQSSPGGVDDDGYVASSANLAHQCDHVQSPVMRLASTSTLSMWTNFDIEGNVWPHPGYHDRANIGVYEVSNVSRTVITPDDGRGYGIPPVPGGTCGTEDQAGWINEMRSWAISNWSSDALGSASYAGQSIQLDIRYGTNTYFNFGGFWFDKVTVTDVEIVGPDLSPDSCAAACSVAADCDDGNVCTDDSCDSASGCVNTDNTAACDDGDACTTSDTCADGICGGGAPLTCDDGNVCTDDSCDSGSGCVNANNTAACDDDDACTTSDTCSAGVCGGGAPLTCDDGNICTDDSCDPGSGCVNASNTVACDDGDACTTSDTCAEGVCGGGAPLTCDDGNICTDDSCDSGSGCVNANNTAACDDDDACTTSDTCSAGVCGSGAPLTCDDGNICTDDSCDPGSGCVNANNTAACDDGDACTTADTCVEGICGGGAPLTCDDGNICTDDSCDSGTGCVHTDNTASCDDGDACTTSDTCADGACVGGTPLSCDDGDACNGSETCDPNSGCLDGTPLVCDDGNACTTDRCDSATGCTTEPLVCNDGDACTDDSCNSETGCVYTNNDACASCDSDGTCELGEDCVSCPSDCISGSTPAAACGNGLCEAGDGENCVTCPADCNGKQVGSLRRQFCCGDGGGGTGAIECTDGDNTQCNADGFSCTDQSQQAGTYCCGDTICEAAEDSSSCSIDCGAPAFCGDDNCDPGEDQCICPEDCGGPPGFEISCSDEVDNDCNGFVDCADSSCSTDAACVQSCLPKGDTCSVNEDCCSGSCKRTRVCR